MNWHQDGYCDGGRYDEDLPSLATAVATLLALVGLLVAAPVTLLVWLLW